MAGKPVAEYARVTAICVNLALDSAEDAIRDELDRATGEATEALRRVLEKLKKKRVTTPQKDQLH